MEYNPNPNTPRGILPVLSWGHKRLPKQHGIVNYKLSNNRLYPFHGIISKGVPNVIRRVSGQALYVAPPFIVAYFLMEWMEEKNKFLNSKKGRMEKGVE